VTPLAMLETLFWL